MRVTRSIGFGLVVLLAAIPGKVKAQGPKGWVGVVITTGIGQANESGALVFADYPVIESIDPGSPAEKAGLLAGDILIAINAQDFRKNPIPMGSLLVPGRKIVFRYRRDDVERTSTMLVGERPENTVAYWEYKVIGPAPAEAAAIRRARSEALLNRNVRVGGPTREPMISISPLVIGSGSPTLRLVGAEITQLNAGLRELLKFKGRGVFVINVAMGTPAGEAGLKSGDVITQAANEPLENPGELLRLLHAATENTIMLRVIRKQKEQSVALSW